MVCAAESEASPAEQAAKVTGQDSSVAAEPDQANSTHRTGQSMLKVPSIFSRCSRLRRWVS